jgi:uncharacterized damage-inducible protein DinB
MELKGILLAQLDREAAASRKVVEQVPEGKNDWKPHQKSMPLGYLAALVATMPGWVSLMIERDELNLDDASSEQFKTKAVKTKAELVQQLEEGVAKSRAALENTTDAHLMKPWKFMMGGRVVNQEPRYVMVLNSVFSHLAHHRGQLTVYLRLNDAKVPAIFGPSADEKF